MPKIPSSIARILGARASYQINPPAPQRATRLPSLVRVQSNPQENPATNGAAGLPSDARLSAVAQAIKNAVDNFAAQRGDLPLGNEPVSLVTQLQNFMSAHNVEPERENAAAGSDAVEQEEDGLDEFWPDDEWDDTESLQEADVTIDERVATGGDYDQAVSDSDWETQSQASDYETAGEDEWELADDDADWVPADGGAMVNVHTGEEIIYEGWAEDEFDVDEDELEAENEEFVDALENQPVEQHAESAWETTADIVAEEEAVATEPAAADEQTASVDDNTDFLQAIIQRRRAINPSGEDDDEQEQVSPSGKINFSRTEDDTEWE